MVYGMVYGWWWYGFPDDNNNPSFKFKQKITGQRGNGGPKDVDKMVQLKYLSIFWRTFEMSLINCEINFILTWSAKCSIMTNGIVKYKTIRLIKINF